MILPILSYGNPLLKQEAEEIDPDYPKLQQLIANMFETMYNAEGVGLAAPQIGHGIRLFVVDGSKMDESLEGFKRVFINPEIIEFNGQSWDYEEGCLSIPHVKASVNRPDQILINYLNENFEEQEEWLSGFSGRVVQHEYDHIDGILFTDHLSPLKKRMLKKKLDKVTKGDVDVGYRMKFPTKKRAVQ